eukprot:2935059-Rhodomonas_salina.1
MPGLTYVYGAEGRLCSAVCSLPSGTGSLRISSYASATRCPSAEESVDAGEEEGEEERGRRLGSAVAACLRRCQLGPSDLLSIRYLSPMDCLVAPMLY